MEYQLKKDLVKVLESREQELTAEGRDVLKLLKADLDYFDITSVCRGDIETIADKDLSDDDMVEIAADMEEAYLHNGFGEDVDNAINNVLY
jgi:hypothetical protein